MGLKEEMEDMIHLIAEPLNKEEYDIYSVETDCIRDVCELYNEDVTYGESAMCDRGHFACLKCEHCQKIKVDLSFWDGSDLYYNYRFGSKEEAPSVKVIKNRKQLLKEMTELKTEMEYYKDFCAEFGEKYKEYLEYAKKFADKVQKKHFSIFGVVQTEILPIIFHTDYETDKEHKINYRTQGNLKICGKQTVMNIYCCLSDFEEVKKFIRHEVLHYMLYIAGFQYKDDSAIFHYFCNKYDAHAYKKMPEEQQQLYDKLQNAEVALTQLKEIPEDQRDAAVNGMIVTIGVTEENEELYKDTISCGNKLMKMYGMRSKISE